MYTVLCALYSVHCTLCTVLCDPSFIHRSFIIHQSFIHHSSIIHTSFNLYLSFIFKTIFIHLSFIHPSLVPICHHKNIKKMRKNYHFSWMKHRMEHRMDVPFWTCNCESMNETQNGTCVQFGTQGTVLDLKFETKYPNGRGHWYRSS